MRSTTNEYISSLHRHLHVLLLLGHPVHPEHLRGDPEVGPVLRGVEADLQVGEDGREEQGGRIRVRSDSRRRLHGGEDAGVVSEVSVVSPENL